MNAVSKIPLAVCVDFECDQEHILLEPGNKSIEKFSHYREGLRFFRLICPKSVIGNVMNCLRTFLNEMFFFLDINNTFSRKAEIKV